MTEHPDQLLLLAQVAETWGSRPSEILRSPRRPQDDIRAEGDLPAVMALQIDVAAAVALWRWKEQLAAEAVSR